MAWTYHFNRGNLDESAAVDGCGYVRFVFSILMPLIRPAIATVTVIHAIGIWNELILATVYLTDDDLYLFLPGTAVQPISAPPNVSLGAVYPGPPRT